MEKARLRDGILSKTMKEDANTWTCTGNYSIK